MRKKGLLLTGLCILCLALISLYGCAQKPYQTEGLAAGEATGGAVPGEKIKIAHAQVFGTLQRPPVIFDHGKHLQVAKEEGCTVCHPVDEENKVVFEFPKAGKSNRNPKLLRNDYHRECIGCHKKAIKEAKKSAPLACGECHVRGTEKVKTAAYPAVAFFQYHSAHILALKEEVESKKPEDTCRLCHHAYDPEKRKLVYKEQGKKGCTYCHGPFEETPLPSLSTEVSLTTEKGLTMRKVGHSLCLNCHLTYAKKGLKTAPVACSECHKR